MNIVEMVDDSMHAMGSRFAFLGAQKETARRGLRKTVRAANALVFAVWEPVSFIWWATTLCIKFVGLVLVLWLSMVIYATNGSFDPSYAQLGSIIHAYASSANSAATIATDLKACIGVVLGGVVVLLFVWPRLILNWRSPVDRYIDQHLDELIASKLERANGQ